MASIRKTTTASGATAVQVVEYVQRTVRILKHIGSGHTPEEIAALVHSARAWMEQKLLQPSLFPKKIPRVLPLATSQYIGVTHQFAYEILFAIAKQCGFDTQNDRLLLDFAIIRLIEPASKRRSIELLKRYFDISYARRSVHRMLPHLHTRQTAVEEIAVAFAKGARYDIGLVLYDVTTLYFETFDADDLRVPGFSKDNKSQQPQLVIGLLVSREGFPLGYGIFPGNTFEGKTMLPVLEAFTKKHAVTTPTVVADAAMLSETNIGELKQKGISYIVGARMANCALDIITQAANALDHVHDATVRIATTQGDLIVSFSAKRFRKDTAEMEKQIEKGKKLIARNEPGKRAKFVQRTGNADAYILNTALIEKTKLLLGMKGYYTNIPERQLSNKEIIERYHDLWHVEQAFRMAKSDIAARPIFHYTEDAVRTHMLICFVALVLGKYMEIQTDLSLKRIVDLLWNVTDATIMDTNTQETFVLRSQITTEVQELLKKLRVSY